MPMRPGDIGAIDMDGTDPRAAGVGGGTWGCFDESADLGGHADADGTGGEPAPPAARVDVPGPDVAADVDAPDTAMQVLTPDALVEVRHLCRLARVLECVEGRQPEELEFGVGGAQRPRQPQPLGAAGRPRSRSKSRRQSIALGFADERPLAAAAAGAPAAAEDKGHAMDGAGDDDDGGAAFGAFGGAPFDPTPPAAHNVAGAPAAGDAAADNTPAWLHEEGGAGDTFMLPTDTAAYHELVASVQNIGVYLKHVVARLVRAVEDQMVTVFAEHYQREEKVKAEAQLLARLASPQLAGGGSPGAAASGAMSPFLSTASPPPPVARDWDSLLRRGSPRGRAASRSQSRGRTRVAFGRGGEGTPTPAAGAPAAAGVPMTATTTSDAKIASPSLAVSGFLQCVVDATVKAVGGGRGVVYLHDRPAGVLRAVASCAPDATRAVADIPMGSACVPCAVVQSGIAVNIGGKFVSASMPTSTDAAGVDGPNEDRSTPTAAATSPHAAGASHILAVPVPHPHHGVPDAERDATLCKGRAACGVIVVYDKKLPVVPASSPTGGRLRGFQTQDENAVASACALVGAAMQILPFQQFLIRNADALPHIAALKKLGAQHERALRQRAAAAGAVVPGASPRPQAEGSQGKGASRQGGGGSQQHTGTTRGPRGARRTAAAQDGAGASATPLVAAATAQNPAATGVQLVLRVSKEAAVPANPEDLASRAVAMPELAELRGCESYITSLESTWKQCIDEKRATQTALHDAQKKLVDVRCETTLSEGIKKNLDVMRQIQSEQQEARRKSRHPPMICRRCGRGRATPVESPRSRTGSHRGSLGALVPHRPPQVDIGGDDVVMDAVGASSSSLYCLAVPSKGTVRGSPALSGLRTASFDGHPSTNNSPFVGGMAPDASLPIRRTESIVEFVDGGDAHWDHRQGGERFVPVPPPQTSQTRPPRSFSPSRFNAFARPRTVPGSPWSLNGGAGASGHSDADAGHTGRLPLVAATAVTAAPAASKSTMETPGSLAFSHSQTSPLERNLDCTSPAPSMLTANELRLYLNTRQGRKKKESRVLPTLQGLMAAVPAGKPRRGRARFGYR